MIIDALVKFETTKPLCYDFGLELMSLKSKKCFFPPNKTENLENLMKKLKDSPFSITASVI